MKFGKLLFLSIMTILFIPMASYSGVDCSDSLEGLPILSGGRVKPLRVHSREMIKFISGKSKWNKKSSTVVYCQQSLRFLEPEKKGSGFIIPIQINHVDTRSLLGISQDQKTISYSEAQKMLPEMEKALLVLKRSDKNSPQTQDLNAVVLRTKLSGDLLEGHNWRVPIIHEHAGPKGSTAQWATLGEMVQFASLQDSRPSEVLKRVINLGNRYQKSVDSTYLKELTFEKLHLFHWAILATLVTLGLTILLRRPTHPLLLISLSIALIIQITGIIFRISISNRGPVTNMYETVMWVGLGGLAFATFLSFLNREKIYLQVGLFLNIACLFMMTFAHGMLDSNIKPLVPVLRDNFWLSTHVTTITISYAVFSLSWIIANFYMIRAILSPPSAKFTRRMNDLSYQCLKYGVVLLAAGIILGGIWADYSWGRFWGWDPKETWSLISLMIYIAILHGRITGWVTPSRFLPLVAIAFMSVLMTWFGVNYILAVGLHSYGFSEGGALFLLSIFLVQVLILAVYLIRVWQYHFQAEGKEILTSS